MNKLIRFGVTFAAIIVALFVFSTGGAAPLVQAQEPEGTEAAVAWDTDGNNVPKNSFLGTTNNRPLVFKTNNVEQMRILSNGNVGIGTKAPTTQLHVNGANARLRLESSASQLWTTTEYKTNAREWHTGVGGSTVPNDLKNKYYIHDATAGATRVVVNQNGGVGIGMTDPGTARLVVRGSNVNYDTLNTLITSSNGELGFLVRNSGHVEIGKLGPSTTQHLCHKTPIAGAGSLLTGCSSAAEYVPSIDGGKGYPETADLVSIAPNVKNPYGDTHGPFAVQKSAKACDTNLLGYIVKPESGADGVKLNDRYLPLAIYGYFPAKVTMENGPIKRGDPITSSSKAGYGMKATDACKVIGYALEDASKEGTIQVFASFGENTAPEVTNLRGQVKNLTQENQALKTELNAINTRLAALEQTAPMARNAATQFSTSYSSK